MSTPMSTSSTTSPLPSASPAPSADDLIWVTAWDTPTPVERGHDPRSVYAEQFWLGILGPSTLWLLRHCVHELDATPDGFVLELPLVASSLGLGHRGGRHSALSRAIARAVRFGMAREVGDRQLEVRRRLPSLTRSQLARLPVPLQQRHRLVTGDAGAGTLEYERSRARCLAAALAACGEPAGRIEAGLGLLGIHPSLAAEAARALADHAPAG